MEKDNCQKCGEYGWVHKHHVLPKAEFGGEGEVIRLCPNCHTKYHKILGHKNLKGNSMEFHFEHFYKWLYLGLAVILAVTLILNFA